MRTWSRRSILSAFGIALPFGPGVPVSAMAHEAPVIRFRSFEEDVRAMIADRACAARQGEASGDSSTPCRIEVGPSGLVRAGLQGCHNDRPFAGFPAGRLRIVRTGFEPGPVRQGVRFYITTVDLELIDGIAPREPSCPLDFGSLAPASALS